MFKIKDFISDLRNVMMRTPAAQIKCFRLLKNIIFLHYKKITLFLNSWISLLLFRFSVRRFLHTLFLKLWGYLSGCDIISI